MMPSKLLATCDIASLSLDTTKWSAPSRLVDSSLQIEKLPLTVCA